MLVIYTLLVKDYSQSETWFKEKSPKGEIDPCSVFVRKIKQQQLDRVADSVGGIQQQHHERFKSPGMLLSILYEIREQKHGQDFENIRARRQMTGEAEGEVPIVTFDEEESGKTAQHNMRKAGLEKSLYHQELLTAH